MTIVVYNVFQGLFGHSTIGLIVGLGVSIGFREHGYRLKYNPNWCCPVQCLLYLCKPLVYTILRTGMQGVRGPPPAASSPSLNRPCG